MKKFFGEFSKFIQRGSVIDMAVGVIIGSAFSTIVNSLVNDIIMPVIAVITSSNNFTNLAYTTSHGAVIAYGNFIQSVVNFLIIALVLFIVVREMNRIKDISEKKLKLKKEEEQVVVEDSDELKTLKEIRDLLKK